MPSYRAVYAYEPRADIELLLNEGEVVKELERDTGDGWTKVSGKNGSGLVPSSYIEACADPVAPPPPPPPAAAHSGGAEEVEALYDYSDPSDSKNLDIVQGVRYTLLDGTATDWWQVRTAEGKVGFVPATYVKKVESRGRKDSGSYGFPPSSPAPAGPVAPVAPTAPGSAGMNRSRGQQQSYRGISPTEKRRLEQQQRELNKGKVDQEAEVEIRAIQDDVTALHQRLQEGTTTIALCHEKIKALEDMRNAGRQRIGLTPQHSAAQILKDDENKLRQIQQLLQ